jgi:hypothetical protein
MNETTDIHLFNISYPTLGEDVEDIWYRHPEFPLQCNQVGLIVVDENVHWTISNGCLSLDYELNGERFKKRRGILDHRLVYECYFGKLTLRDWIFYKNMNVYDLRPDNLITLRRGDPDFKYYNKRKSDFIDNTINYMKRKSQILDKKGINPKDYWEMLSLPKDIIKEFRKQMGYDEETRRGRKYFRGEERLKIAKDCYELRKTGLSFWKISEKLGLNNHTITRKLIIDYEKHLEGPKET